MNEVSQVVSQTAKLASEVLSDNVETLALGPLHKWLPFVP